MDKRLLKKEKIRKLILSLILLVIAVAAIIMAVISINDSTSGGDTNNLRVAVITKSSESGFWKEFLYGVDAAAQEYNINYYTASPENEEDADAQNDMIEAAINDGVDVIILSAISAESASVYVERAKAVGIYVIIADSGVETDNIDLEVGTDNYQAGRQMGAAVCEMDIDVINVGVINFDAVSDNGQLRQQGFMDVVADDERINVIAVENVKSNISSAKNKTIDMLEQYPDINVVVTMNEWTTLGVGYAIEEMLCAGGVQVYGFDSNKFCIDMLETGYIDGLIVQNPFAMGYLCLENAYNLYHGKNMENDIIYTDTFLVTRDNLYDTDTQKVIFSIK